MSDVQSPRLWPYALFAAALSAAGLPLYIHAPKVYVDTYGVSLALLGWVLFGLRLLDVVQDPLLGKLSSALRHHRSLAIGVAAAIIAASMIGLFAVEPPLPPLLWFALMITLVFSSYSFLTISFYAQGVQTADRLGSNGHIQLARWRETGALIGVCLAAIAPVALALWLDLSFAAYAFGFAAFTVISTYAMRSEWRSAGVIHETNFRAVFEDRTARDLLLLAFVNAAPTAVTSTLLLFFVESRLGAPGAEGVFIVLFFVSAAFSVAVWGQLAERYGIRPVLLTAMSLSVLAFIYALGLGQGDTLAFGVICVVTGAALGADMTLLPAAFARRMAQISPDATEGFALWSFVSKFTLAFAAVLLLPTLESAGFASGTQDNSEDALRVLSWLYAGLPCALKLLSIVLLLRVDLGEEN